MYEQFKLKWQVKLRCVKEIKEQVDHVLGRIQNLILDYYNNSRVRVSSGPLTSAWHQVKEGIITGCTIMVPLFSLSMNTIVSSPQKEHLWMTLRWQWHRSLAWLLRGLEQLISWVRMSFKPAKSRSLVLRKGKVADQFCFNLGGTQIPTLSEKPIKSLSKSFDSFLKDTAPPQQTRKDFTTWLTAINRSVLPRKFKAWMFQHGVLARVVLRLLVYEVQMTTVDPLEKSCTQHLRRRRRWLGLPWYWSSIAFPRSCNSPSVLFQRNSWSLESGRLWCTAIMDLLLEIWMPCWRRSHVHSYESC